MNDLNELFLYLKFITNKEKLGGKFGPDDFNRLIKVVNFEHFKKKYGLPEEYQIGMPFSRQSFEVTQNIIDSMNQFKVVMGDINMPLSVDPNGHAMIPPDYLHAAGFSYIQNTDCNSNKYRVIEPMTENEWYSRVGSSINPPSYKYPICRIMSNYIQFLPKDIQFVEFVYLRKPITPEYAYTINTTTDELVYNQSSSTQMEWDEIDMIDISQLLLSKLGINLRSQELINYAELIKAKGV